MTLRNSLVVAAAMKRAASLGMKHAAGPDTSHSTFQLNLSCFLGVRWEVSVTER